MVSDSNDAEDNLILLKEMRAMTEDFFLRMRQVAAVLKARHVSELVRLRKLRVKQIHGKTIEGRTVKHIKLFLRMFKSFFVPELVPLTFIRWDVHILIT